MVGEKVVVGDAVDVGVSASRVEVEVAGAGTDGVAVGGMFEGVAVVTTSGTSTNVDIAANRKPATRIIGKAYFLSISGNAAAVEAGSSPEYPIASRRFLRLTA